MRMAASRDSLQERGGRQPGYDTQSAAISAAFAAAFLEY